MIADRLRISALSALVILTFSTAFVANTSAAEIKVVSDVSLGTIEMGFADTCNFTLEGEIADGDSAKLRTILSKEMSGDALGKFGVLCLDSTGGSFAEAIKIIDLMIEEPTGTYIRQGAKCLSACSLIFMAGRMSANEVGPVKWRYLHVGGQLGFHSPSLMLQEGKYDKVIVEAAYQAALQSLSDAMVRLALENDSNGDPWVRPSLLYLMLSTPPDSMTYIDTLDEVGRWSIGFVPEPAAIPFARHDLRRGCNNLRAWERDESAIEPKAEVVGEARIERRTGDYGRIEHHITDSSGMYIFGCKFVYYERDTDSPKAIQAVPFFEGVDDQTTIFAGYSFLPPETSLTEVQSKIDTLKSTNLSGTGARCTIMVDGKTVDDEPCQRSELQPASADLVSVEQFLWPSGSKTIVTRGRNGTFAVNGEQALLENQPGRQCYSKKDPSRLFCYIPL